MSHEFVILKNGNLETYDKYDDIPDDFDHLIKFLPDLPAGPHTEEEHEEIHAWNDKLQALMEIERKNAGSL